MPKFVQSIRKREVAAYLAVSLALLAAPTAAVAVTCDDVRSLSSEQQNYWAKRFNLSADQKHRIWIACYHDYHPRPTISAQR